MTGKPAAVSPTVNMKMSPEAKAKMRATEKAVYKYYNDMRKNKGHCTWGAGILAHKGVCSEEELGKKVSATMVEVRQALAELTTMSTLTISRVPLLIFLK